MNINHRLFGSAAFALALMSGASAGTVESPYATGGEVTKILTANGQYEIYIHTFTNTEEAAEFRNVGNRTLSLRYLVVGAGGAGGCGSSVSAGQYKPSGGGGGGGGVFETQGVSFAAGASWSILVGKGAIANKTVTDPATVAGTSSISNGTKKVVEVPGGGNGAKASTSKTGVVAATAGAAGGGGVQYAAGGTNGTYKSSIFGDIPEGAPFSGGDATSSSYAGGGGGGAGAAGKASTTTSAGDGGEGLASDITGESLVYGSGGGGGANDYRNRVGGLGGTRAGDGATYEIVGTTTNFIAATSPAANSGGGGAGGTLDSVCRASSAGADGIVVIRYQVSIAPCEGGDIVTKTLVRGTRYAYVHIFTNTAAKAELVNGSDRELSLRYLVVGGGGAGANGLASNCGGAGGGGGGVVEARGLRLNGAERLTVEVGQGASRIYSSNLDPVAGASTLWKGDAVIVSAPGGGNAGYYNSTASKRRAPTSGANGGGGSLKNEDGALGGFTNSINGVKYGPFAGGDYYSKSYTGGSGAGAGENGKTTAGVEQAATGGEGLASDITGETLVYGSGGGVGEGYGSTSTYPGCQGSDGGTRAGNGGKHDFSFTDNGDGSVTTNWTYIAATAPAANSGAGGAGGARGWKGDAAARSGSGGADGIVVIRYEYDPVIHGFSIYLR